MTAPIRCPDSAVGLHLRARVLLAPCWLAAALSLPAAALAQRQLPQAPQVRTAPLEVAEPVSAPLPIPTVPAAAESPQPGPAGSAPAVTTTTGLVTIESDLQRADRATGVVTSIGNVRIVYPDQRVVATARQAQYFSKEGRVVLSGDVDIVQEGGNLIRAEQVVYLVNAERLQAIPMAGQQVFSRVRLQSQSTTPAAPRSATGTAAAQPVPSAIHPAR